MPRAATLEKALGWLIAVVFVGGVVAACGGTSSSKSAKRASAKPVVTETPVVESTTTTVDPVTAPIIQGYLAYWDAYDAATGAHTGAPNPDDPTIPAHMTGAELKSVRVYSIGLRAKGFTAREDAPTQFHPHVVAATATASTVEDCILDQTSIIDAKTGVKQDSAGPSKEGFSAAMVLEDGAWKASALTRKDELCAGQ